jgi:hypothetical protein
MHKVTKNPFSSTYLLDIAQRLRVDPHRVQCVLSIKAGGGFLIDVAIDGRDLTGPETRTVLDYFEEAFNGTPLKAVDG